MLTNNDQMKDHSFRKQILAQFFVVFQFLIGQSGKEQEKIRALFDKSGISMSRHVNYPFNLSEEQETWVLDARSRCTKTLEKQFPDGRNFLKTFQHVATHERRWTRWKLESCPNAEKSGIDMTDGVPKKKLEVRPSKGS